MLTRTELAAIPGARKTKEPTHVAPQLATLVKTPPAGAAWLHEVKFDGYRMICRISRGRSTFLSRNGKDWTKKVPNLAKAATSLKVSTAILDGEVVAVDKEGRSNFQKLQRSMGRNATTSFAYEVFDLVYLNGFDLTQVPLATRKALLAQVLSASSRSLRYSDHLQGHGDKFFTHACKHRLEGIVSKLANSRYQAGRTRSWLKTKCVHEQEFVIIGFTASSRLPGFGSLALGVYDKNKFTYAGHVGTGFTLAQRRSLRLKLDKLKRLTSPLKEIPSSLKHTKWVKPVLAAQVAFTEWTSDGSIRHPSFKGLREDKNPKEIKRERPIKTPKTKRS